MVSPKGAFWPAETPSLLGGTLSQGVSSVNDMACDCDCLIDVLRRGSIPAYLPALSVAGITCGPVKPEV